MYTCVKHVYSSKCILPFIHKPLCYHDFISFLLRDFLKNLSFFFSHSPTYSPYIVLFVPVAHRVWEDP